MRQYPNIPVEKCPDGKPTWWKVTEDTHCFDLVDGSRYTIPAGFISNFASVPALLYVWIPPHGPSAIPSVKHDYRYTELVGVEKHGYEKARLYADQQYYFDLIEAGVSRRDAWLMFAAVRVCGWWPWQKHIRKKLLRLVAA